MTDPTPRVSYTRWYLALVVVLGLLIFLFERFTRHFS